MLFTRNDHPHKNNKTLEVCLYKLKIKQKFYELSFKRLAKNRAKDLNDIGIALELIPVICEGEEFSYSKFYAVRQNIIMDFD